MKKSILGLSGIVFILTSCVENSETGEMEPGWLFWVFLGLIVAGLIFGVIYKSMKKKPDDAPTRYEEEIEAFEQTLEKKEQEQEESEKKEPEVPDNEDRKDI